MRVSKEPQRVSKGHWRISKWQLTLDFSGLSSVFFKGRATTPSAPPISPFSARSLIEVSYSSSSPSGQPQRKTDDPQIEERKISRYAPAGHVLRGSYRFG